MSRCTITVHPNWPRSPSSLLSMFNNQRDHHHNDCNLPLESELFPDYHNYQVGVCSLFLSVVLYFSFMVSVAAFITGEALESTFHLWWWCVFALRLGALHSQGGLRKNQRDKWWKKDDIRTDRNLVSILDLGQRNDHTCLQTSCASTVCFPFYN